MNKISTAQILQFAGILGFALAFLQFEIGWFIGFFCTGIYFILRKENKKKFQPDSGNLSPSIFILLLIYSN
ncbi:hypothetical protein [Peribacillus cavernae]|uniref:hypothetical protein n=1 Tax=Peribacillus cavernae TaxID=1674310 RepID=UPI001FE67ED6|nr:hypothetical protein [Peribacillus cavernae]MDQ0219248.1 cbb3-type cytochrome oxidase subunit 3 [Peribacillus cavernae]